MPASLIHLVRHGEVFNPDGVVYGRIPGFHLSELGHRMASAAAQKLIGHPIARLFASPLQRTQESAQPWAESFGLEIATDDRLIEPTNWFEGKRMDAATFRKPGAWYALRNPFAPSWGEHYADIEARMFAVIADAYRSVDDGEVVVVSHQLPITVVQRSLAGLRLAHNPGSRRCNLSSITTIAHFDGVKSFVEVNYQDPAKELLAASVDEGAS